MYGDMDEETYRKSKEIALFSSGNNNKELL